VLVVWPWLWTSGNAYECHRQLGMSSQWTGKIALTKCKVVRIMTDAFMRTRGGQDEVVEMPRFI
jgi:hypothetical protein